MLNFLREKAGSWLVKFLLGIIICVFILLGVGTIGSQNAGRVALINGVPITIDEYKKSYNNFLDQYRQMYGNRLDAKMLEMFNIKKQALEYLIDQKVMQGIASDLGVRVTDEELAGSIRTISAFQRDGVFDSRQYRNVLTHNRLSPEFFEAKQREAILIDKLRQSVSGSVKVSDLEVKEWYDWENTSIKLDIVKFDPKKYKDIDPSNEEIAAYYSDNGSHYKTEPMVKVKYIKFLPEDYADQGTVLDEDIQAYYEDHQDEFEEPKTVEARHILIKVDQDAPDEEVAKAQERALEVLKLAKEGNDFAELAKKYSEGPSKDNGGSLGAFRKEAMVKPFSDKAFSMNPGEISDPVRTRFGWHLIKVEKINEAKTLTQEEATPQIRSKLQKNKEKNIAYDAADSLANSLTEGDDLEAVAKAKGLKFTETDFFTLRGPDEGVKNKSKFAKEAFNLPPNAFSDAIDMNDEFFVMQLVEKKEAVIPSLEEVKARVKVDLISKIQKEKAEKEANDFLATVKKGEQTFEAAAKAYGITVKTTEFFKRNDPAPGFEGERGIFESAFELSKASPYPEKAVKGDQDYFVFAFKDKKVEAKDFEGNKDSIMERLLNRKKAKVFSAWLAQLKKKSTIKIFQKELLE